MAETTVVALILLFTGMSPTTGLPTMEVQAHQEMSAEECITQADLINNNPELPFIMVCSPKIKGDEIES